MRVYAGELSPSSRETARVSRQTCPSRPGDCASRPDDVPFSVTDVQNRGPAAPFRRRMAEPRCATLPGLPGRGLRLLEALRLRVKDVDFAANLLIVREGKGSKDRRTKMATTSERSRSCWATPT